VKWFWHNTKLPVKAISLFRGELGRRCIGRNMAALQTDADLVWFADVDQVYHRGCLDRLAAMDWPGEASMIFPQWIEIHKDHATGDRYAEAVVEPRLVDIDPDDFIPKKYHRAIGGVQIVGGDFARDHGYLDDDPKWQKPRTDGKPFAGFRDDIEYRKFCQQLGVIVPVDLPGMYRLRHSVTTH
jgi:hypothetical protein